jgi:hypothetical protein
MSRKYFVINKCLPSLFNSGVCIYKRFSHITNQFMNYIYDTQAVVLILDIANQIV